MPRSARALVVKVCGLTRLEDARHALACGADWLGFIVHGESPRRIEPERAGEIAAALPGAVVVAVIVGAGPDEALALARRSGATRVQLHRVDAAAWPAVFALPAAFAVPVDADGRLRATLPPAAGLVLLDTAAGPHAGGSGRPFPWAAAVPLAAERDVMLAGGLGPGNVAEAIRLVRPYGVDASSGLERSPGVKDPDLVRGYVEAARAADGARGAAG